MKIRSGFVSNSSSSSFILNGKNLTVRDVALMMIPLREWSPKDFKDGNSDKVLCARVANLTCHPDTPMTFESCNEDTFIMKKGGYIFVDTCNNHPFRDVLNEHRAGLDNQEVAEILCVDEIENCCGFYPCLSELFYFYKIDEMELLGQGKNERLMEICRSILGKEYDSFPEPHSLPLILERAALKLFIDNSNMKRKSCCVIRNALRQLMETGTI